MSTGTERRSKKSSRYQEYNDFVRQIDITDIRLISAKIDNLGYTDFPSSNQITWRTKSWYENREGEFDAFHRYNMTIKDTGKVKAAARLSVTFCATYSSDIPMSDQFFDIFQERNLPVNTWPYFREFTHNSFARMGWSGLVAPIYLT